MQVDYCDEVIEHLRITSEEGLELVPIDMATVCIIIISNALVATVSGGKRQLGYVVFVAADEKHRTNIMLFGSNRCHRASKLIMAADYLTLVHAYDYGYVIHDAVEAFLGPPDLFEAYVDSRKLLNVVSKNRWTAERKLQIVISALKES